jgi:hypothetical protein
MPASYRSLGGGVSWKAGGTIAPSVFVKRDSTAFQILQADSGNALLGVMQEGQRDAPGTTGADSAVAALSGDKATFNIYQDGDRCRVKLAVAVTAGQAVKASLNGQGAPHTSGAANIGGFALTSGNIGDQVEIIVCCITLTPA